MTQEEEQLLFDDLSGRLRYGVICQIDYHDDAVLWGIPNTDTFTFCDGVIERYISQVKPYLRPMSSMTEEEKVEIQNLYHQNTKEVFKDPSEIRGYRFYDISVVDWLNEHHFDYRGLISMGLALPATEGMYK